MTLLERTTREVRLTPAGAALLDGAARALDAADAAFARAREVGSGTSGTVRVGVSPAVGPAEREEAARRCGRALRAVGLVPRRAARGGSAPRGAVSRLRAGMGVSGAQ